MSSKPLAKAIMLDVMCPSHERPQMRYYMSYQTWMRVRVGTMTYVGDRRLRDERLFGFPVNIDNSMPDGEVELCPARPIPEEPARTLPMTSRERVKSWMRKLS